MLFKKSTSAASLPGPARRSYLKPALLVLVLGAAVGATAWALTQGSDKDQKDGGKKPEQARVFEFAPGDLAQMQRIPMGRVIPVSGSVTPLLQATVRSKVPAEVSRLHVQEGERVAAGTVLVTLDAADLKARHDAQLASVAEARARLDLARKNQVNNKALLEKAFISQIAYDGVANAVQVAQANLQSVEAQATIAQRALADASIRAPFNGIVARKWVNAGDKVSTDMPVVQIVDLARMQLEAQVPISEIPFVKVGGEILFSVDGFPGRKFSGKVERVNPSADQGSRSISVFVAIPNADGSLRGGMFANGTLAASGVETDVIPVTAVQEEGGQKFVLVVKNGKVERRSVSVGTPNVELGMIPVREGLEAGVTVITVKAEGLKPGATAVVKAPGTATQPAQAAQAPKAS